MKQKFEPFTERVYLSSPTMHSEELYDRSLSNELDVDDRGEYRFN